MNAHQDQQYAEQQDEHSGDGNDGEQNGCLVVLHKGLQIRILCLRSRQELVCTDLAVGIENNGVAGQLGLISVCAQVAANLLQAASPVVQTARIARSSP